MIDAWILDWLNVGFRWVHLIAGIGWIGTSLYFMWLDAALIRNDPSRPDVEGHTWLLHSGGAATVLSWALLLAVVYGLTRVLSGRAAYIHTGAMLGTIMVANVWMRIVPAQRDQIAAATAGRTPDATLATRAKQRSTHNSYVTFPVIFMMLSHHYPLTYGHRLNWLILWLLIVVGAGVRHVMIAREHGRRADWWLVPVAAAVAAVVYLTSPAWLGAATRGGERVAFDAANTVIAHRCVSCHSERPSDDIFRIAPNGVTFDTPERI